MEQILSELGTSPPTVAGAGMHAVGSEEALARLRSDPAGLSSEEAARRLAQHGENALPEKKATPLIVIFLRQFKSPLIYLLFVAAFIAFLLDELTDAAVILGVVLVNAVVGVIQEGRAERSMASLLQLSRLKARVLRDGEEQLREARELVPGDVILLAAGDAVPADARILEAAALEAAEAALTGESTPVTKENEPVAADAPIGDRSSILFSGTTLTAGRARAVVFATGSAAEVGKVVRLTEEAQDARTPLELRVEQLGRYLLAAGAVAFVVVMLVGFLRGLPMADVLMVAISQLVSVIPEGLPVAMTIALAVGMQRMAARGAVVRRLSAVESLGSTNIICTDKTGTLTRNEMTVTLACLGDGRKLEVSGVGYGIDGAVSDQGRPLYARDDEHLRRLCEVVALCNDARLSTNGENGVIGDPTEIALLTFAAKAGVDLDALRALHPRSAELPFDSRTKLMATGNGRRVCVKGAPEAVIELCRPETTGAAQSSAQTMADRALRVLAVAELEGSDLDEQQGWDGLRGKLTLLGLVGQIDPPRAEVGEAVATCKRAGVRTVMITGDHKATGLAIARSLGIAESGDSALEQRELSALSDRDLAERLRRVAVFARVQPEEKLRIVDAYRTQGNVVAMTGDGVNDAPALARADVGVAMGITGTDVAKQAAEIVLTDDNFTTIVSAIEEGRIVYQNIKKVILLLLSTGLAELLVLLLAMLLGFPPPFVAVQILWNNVITEGTVTVNLTMDPASGDEMRRDPVRYGAPILDRAMIVRLALMSATITAATLGFFLWHSATGVPHEQARTATFTLLAVCEWFNVLNCRSETRSALSLDILRNRWLVGGLLLSNALQVAVVYLPALNRIFHTVPLPLSEVLLVGAVGSLVLWVEEVRKFFARRAAAG